MGERVVSHSQGHRSVRPSSSNEFFKYSLVTLRFRHECLPFTACDLQSRRVGLAGASDYCVAAILCSYSCAYLSGKVQPPPGSTILRVLFADKKFVFMKFETRTFVAYSASGSEYSLLRHRNCGHFPHKLKHLLIILNVLV